MPAVDSTRAAQVDSYYESFLAADGAAIANGWRTYAAAHPAMDAGTAAQAYANQVLAEGLGTAVGAAVTGTGDAAGQIGAGTAAGAAGVAKSGSGLGALLSSVDAVPKFLSMLTSGNLWMRVGEVIAGLILFGIGVNALFKGKPMSTVTGVAAKAAPLALAG
jgi:hypothetical protein